MFIRLTTVLLAFMSVAQAAQLTAPAEQFAEQIEEAEEIGNRIFEKDQLAARATDALFEAVDIDAGPAVYGWVTVPRGDDWTVRFLTMVSGEHRAVHDVHLTAGRATRVETFETAQPLEDDESAMFAARQSALKSIPFQCTERLNTVVFPSADGDGWTVYVLGATTVPGEILVGGHFRAAVSQDGSEVLEMAKLANTCLKMNPREQARIEGTEEPVAVGVTHVLSQTPTEAHVFLSRIHDMSFLVITDVGVWIVKNGTIQYGSPLPKDGEDEVGDTE